MCRNDSSLCNFINIELTIIYIFIYVFFLNHNSALMNELLPNFRKNSSNFISHIFKTQVLASAVHILYNYIRKYNIA